MVIEMSSVKNLVNARLLASGQDVIEKIVQADAEKEIDRRVGIVRLAIDLEKSFQSNISKLKIPDLVFTPLGGEEQKAHSSQRSKEIKAAEEKLAKLNEVYTAAMNEGSIENFNKLETFINQNKTQKPA